MFSKPVDQALHFLYVINLHEAIASNDLDQVKKILTHWHSAFTSKHPYTSKTALELVQDTSSDINQNETHQFIQQRFSQ